MRGQLTWDQKYERRQAAPSNHFTSRPFSVNWQANAAPDPSRCRDHHVGAVRQSASWKPPSP